MPAHAILITYRDMEKQMSELVKKATLKYTSFKQLYFDSGYQLSFSLRYVVDRIPKKDKLKIYISGHGGTGIQYITAEDRVRKQTVGDLAVLLADGLINRATSMGDSANTEVNMASCLFGRISSAGLAECPAVRLHAALATKEVYVDLVARTEYVAAKDIGRVTMSLRHRNIDQLKIDKLVREGRKDELTYEDLATVRSWVRQKTKFTKVRCTYRSGAPVVLIRDYDKGGDVHINSDSTEGRRILWADNVINELVEYITPPSGQTKVTDARHKILYRTVEVYDEMRDPDALFKLLRALDLKSEIATHSETAGLIKKLLSAYPSEGRLKVADTLIENFKNWF